MIDPVTAAVALERPISNNLVRACEFIATNTDFSLIKLTQALNIDGAQARMIMDQLVGQDVLRKQRHGDRWTLVQPAILDRIIQGQDQVPATSLIESQEAVVKGEAQETEASCAVAPALAHEGLALVEVEGTAPRTPTFPETKGPLAAKPASSVSLAERIEDLPLARITVDREIQMRAAMDKKVIEEYAAAMEANSAFPPVTVYSDGKCFWLADGFHRFAAAQFLGRHAIRAAVIRGDRREALLFAAGSNAQHGVRRSNADKHKAALVLLRDSEWGAWSNGEIARRCHVDSKTVGKYRDSISGSSVDAHRKVSRGGKTFDMNTANIGPTRDDLSAGPALTQLPQQTLSCPKMEATDLLKRSLRAVAECKEAACWKLDGGLSEEEMRRHVVKLSSIGKSYSKLAHILARTAEEKGRRRPAAA